MEISNNHPYIGHVQRWGNVISLALLDPATHFFTMPGMQGIIGYRIAFNCVVVFGDPVCPENELAELSKAFDEHFRKENKKIVYICVSEQFTNWLLANTCKVALEYGHDIIIDPSLNLLEMRGKRACNLRKICNSLSKENIKFYEYKERSNELDEKLEKVAEKWSKNRTGTQIFFCDLNVFSNAASKRWFYTKVNDEITGLAILNRFDKYNAWALYMLMVVPGCHKYASEKLVFGLLDILKREGCTYFAMGSYQTPELGRIEGLGPITQKVTRRIYKLTEKMFKTSERRRYWTKFSPHLNPSFAVFSDKISITSLLAIVRTCHGI